MDKTSSISRNQVNSKAQPLKSTECPYLDTIQRSMLDFDFEKVCSVTLSNINVYACLVCGVYFQGRGKTSPAFFHSLHEDHHIFINLQTLEVYCLPDNYQVIDTSFRDIQYVLNPIFSEEEVALLDKSTKLVYDLNKKCYIPGFIGLNNIKANDYVNVVFQALAHVSPIRNYFLLFKSSPMSSPLLVTFSELVRKLWNTKAFKGQVSPHELLQTINNTSERKYSLTKQADSAEFFIWLLNTLASHIEKNCTKRKKSNIIWDTFQGKISVKSRKTIEPSKNIHDKNNSNLEPAQSKSNEPIHIFIFVFIFI